MIRVAVIDLMSRRLTRESRESRTGAVTAALARGLIPEPLPGPTSPTVRPHSADAPNPSDRPDLPAPQRSEVPVPDIPARRARRSSRPRRPDR
ncbi:hypothetical protein ACFU8W_30925 [Streptomyces sp. NPDC057565]|uniref:hypothetical protein n=1 Tax=Streptomyces sp. NPDC057565 TaxID=3346169 RepID=UPI0036C29BE4